GPGAASGDGGAPGGDPLPRAGAAGTPLSDRRALREAKARRGAPAGLKHRRGARAAQGAVRATVWGLRRRPGAALSSHSHMEIVDRRPNWGMKAPCKPPDKGPN